MYNLHILKLSERLKKFEKETNHIAETTLNRVENKIKNLKVDIVVSDQPHSVIPEIGLGGYAPTKNVLYIYTDPGREIFSEIIQRDLPRTLAHELHHCARWQSIGYGKTLLEAMVSEGLADHFDIEINHVDSPPWSTALKEQEITELLVRARKSFHDNNYDFIYTTFGATKINFVRES